MATYSYPGVYIQEIPSAVHSITGVATSIAAFIGWAAKGPVDEAGLVLSWMDFQRIYGGLDQRSYLGYAVQQFFSNGGQQAYIVRLATSTAGTTTAAAATATITAGAGSYTITAKQPGTWANSYGVQISASSDKDPNKFMLSVVYAPLGSTVQTIESFDELPFDPVSVTSNYIALVESTTATAVPNVGVTLLAGGVDGNAALPAALGITGLTFDTTGTTGVISATIAAPSISTGLTLTAVNPGTWGNLLAVQIQPRADNYARFSLSVLATNPTTLAQSTVESFSNLSLDPSDPSGQYLVDILNEQSAFLSASMGTTTALTLTNKPATLPTTSLKAGALTLWLVTGADGDTLSPTTTDGTPGAFETALNLDGSLTNGSGVPLLDPVPLFNLLVVPGEFDPATIASLQVYARNSTAFLIVDCDCNATFTTLTDGPDSLMTGANAINSAFYFPWVNVFDPVRNVTRAFPPSGFVAGLYAATDATRGVWKSPAGIDASLTGEAGLTQILTDQQNGVLNVQAINCLRNFRVYGDVVWGARTLRGNDQVGSEWKYLSVRRLALFLETSLYDGTQWVVFEPNDETLWSQIRLNIGAFLQGLFLQGAFSGTSPQQAYFVKCDAENNPPASVANGIVTITVGFAPVYPAEFVVIQIEQIAGQLQS